MHCIGRALIALLATALPALAGDGDAPATGSVTATGVVRASERVELRTDLLAAVREVHRREGEAFERGEVLIAFDCARHQADHRAADARARAAEAEAQQIAHLHALGAEGSGQTRVARARAVAARADADAHRSRIEDCALAAPFDGRVAGVSARAHAVPERGASLMELVGSAAPEIEMVVPSEWLRWLRVGAPLRFAVRETGATIDARVERLGAKVDPVSRTVALYAVPTRADGLLSGMSGTATFRVPE